VLFRSPRAKNTSIIPFGMGELKAKGKEMCGLFGFGGTPFLDKVSSYA